MLTTLKAKLLALIFVLTIGGSGFAGGWIANNCCKPNADCCPQRWCCRNGG